MSKLCAMEAIETLEQWSAMATRTGDTSPMSFVEWMKSEHDIVMWDDFLTVEDAMKVFVAHHVG